jgi:predicted amidohydrolase
MRLSIFQGPAALVPILDALDRAAAEAASTGSTFLILPELFLTGYNIGADALRALAEPPDGPSATAIAAIARRHRIALLYGYPERGPGGHLYNSALLVTHDGRIAANYRKSHLFGAMEIAVFTPGEAPLILAEIDGLKLGILICYDVEFPELVRTLAVQGADLVAVPTAQMHPYEFVPQVLIRARAYENSLFLAYANRCGTEADLIYTGESCIVGPDGHDLARAGLAEALISADLDPAALIRARQFNTFLADRRPALYGALTKSVG